MADAGKHVLLPSTEFSSRSPPSLTLLGSLSPCEEDGEAVSETDGDALVVPEPKDADGVAEEASCDILTAGVTVFSGNVGAVGLVLAVGANETVWDGISVTVEETEAVMLGELVIKAVGVGETVEEGSTDFLALGEDDEATLVDGDGLRVEDALEEGDGRIVGVGDKSLIDIVAEGVAVAVVCEGKNVMLVVGCSACFDADTEGSKLFEEDTVGIILVEAAAECEGLFEREAVGVVLTDAKTDGDDDALGELGIMLLEEDGDGITLSDELSEAVAEELTVGVIETDAEELGVELLDPEADGEAFGLELDVGVTETLGEGAALAEALMEADAECDVLTEGELLIDGVTVGLGVLVGRIDTDEVVEGEADDVGVGNCDELIEGEADALGGIIDIDGETEGCTK
ncbi:cell wall surface anchored protein [Gracilaria domingensis]|nr:cell wall surface anchored protein [Gracilaria domingensis]